MKEPKAHYRADDDYYGDGVCAEDGKEWPCKTWRKWLKSDSYRIAELERKLAGEAQRNQLNNKRLNDLYRDAHRSKLIQDAQIEWLTALGKYTGLRDGIDIDISVEERDITTLFDTRRVVVPDIETFRVRFGDGEWKE